MGAFGRILGMLPKNLAIPAIVLAAGWYGGAKYGAPDYVLNSVDDMIAKGGDIIGVLMGGNEEEADDTSEA